tara:strand:+ start:1370 stop:2134 length:765 start_codon:yes stop_codon:yes gene_type:complete
MYQIPINHKTGKVYYSIYTKEEADKQGIEYKYWQDVRQGEYALSDDNLVALVIKKTHYPHEKTGGKSIYLRFPWGYFMYQPHYKTTKLKAQGRSTPHTMTGKSQLEVRAGQDKMKNLAMAYAQTMDYNLSIDMALGSTTPSEYRKWKRHMKSEVFRGMVRSELEALLEDTGKDKEYTLALMDKAIEMAIDKKDVTNLMRATEKLMDLHGMNEKTKTVTTHQLEAVQTKKLLDEINVQENKLTAKEVVEKEGDGL